MLLSSANVTPLLVTNVVLGAACAAAILAVAVAVWLDCRRRRRARAIVPDGWPP